MKLRGSWSKPDSSRYLLAAKVGEGKLGIGAIA